MWSNVRAWTLVAFTLAGAACGDDGPTDVGPELYTYAAPADIGDGLGGAHATSVAMDASRLQAMVREIEDGTRPNIHSVLVYRSGDLVLEEYFAGVMRSDDAFHEFGRDTLHDMYSVSKSFTSAAVGLALAAGAITGVDQEVKDFFPDYVHLGGALASGELEVRHLLSMTAGLEWDESSVPYTDPANSGAQMRDSPDPIEFLFSLPQVEPPGTAWVYNTGLTTILGEIVARSTGVAFDAYLAEELFAPLGIDEYAWLEDYYNIDLVFAGGGLQLRPRDMVKFGVLYMNGGLWQGEQVVPADWIEQSTAPQAPEIGYGYQWWLGAWNIGSRTLEFFRAVGLGGQHIFVFPEVELVVAFTGNGSGVEPYNLMGSYILPGTF